MKNLKNIIVYVLLALLMLGIFGVVFYFGVNKKEEDPLIINRGVISSIKDGSLSNTGVTLIITNLDSTDYTFGEAYTIEKNETGEWIDVDTIIDDYGFHMIGYNLKSGQTREIELNWEWLYGKLPVGYYRINKEFIYGSESDRQTYSFSAEFELYKEVRWDE